MTHAVIKQELWALEIGSPGLSSQRGQILATGQCTLLAQSSSMAFLSASVCLQKQLLQLNTDNITANGLFGN